LTEDAWIDDITRSMLARYPDSQSAQFGIVTFAISYYLLGGLVLLNIVMAILVGEFGPAHVALCMRVARKFWFICIMVACRRMSCVGNG
jgi:hypothetical protein